MLKYIVPLGEVSFTSKRTTKETGRSLKKSVQIMRTPNDLLLEAYCSHKAVCAALSG
jgi:hypothetical protein